MALDEQLFIVVSATGQYHLLFNDILKPSIQKVESNIPSDEIIGLTEGAQGIYDLAGNTDSASYKELMLERIKTYLALVKNNKGQKILFLDCDVVATAPFKEEILAYLDEWDFVMQQNYIAGIWGVNCNDRSINFFEEFVSLIAQIPPEERQDGYPQFELGDHITHSIENQHLKVLELPEKFGFLTPETVLYHAINAGAAIPAKAITLYSAYMFMNRTVYNIIDNEEKLVFYKTGAHNTLNFFAAFRWQDRLTIQELVSASNGATSWEPAEEWQLDHRTLFDVLNEDNLLVLLAASWCGLEKTPRYTERLSVESWRAWLQHLRS